MVEVLLLEVVLPLVVLVVLVLLLVVALTSTSSAAPTALVVEHSFDEIHALLLQLLEASCLFVCLFVADGGDGSGGGVVSLLLLLLLAAITLAVIVVFLDGDVLQPQWPHEGQNSDESNMHRVSRSSTDNSQNKKDNRSNIM